MNREEQTYPVQELRELARRMGLLRKHRGVLLRTAVGRRLTQGPAGLWWQVADNLPPTPVCLREGLGRKWRSGPRPCGNGSPG